MTIAVIWLYIFTETERKWPPFFRIYFVNSFFVYENYCTFIKLTMTLKQNLDHFVFWLNLQWGRTKMAIISHMSFSISFSYREIAVLWLYKFTLRRKQSGYHIADHNFQFIILVWASLSFDIKVTLRRRKSGCSFADDLVLRMLESLTAPFSHWWL